MEGIGSTQHRQFIVAVLLVASRSLVISTPKATAGATVPPAISNHGVPQRDSPLPIWGTAAPGEKVAVGFRDQERSAAVPPVVGKV